MFILTMCLFGKPQQLVGKATMADSVINSCQIDKYNVGHFLSLERILDVLGQ